MRAKVILLGIVLSALAISMPTITPEGLAQDVSPQAKEAVVFFTQLADTSDNPMIKAMAKENLRRLTKKEAATKQGTTREVEVSLIAQVNNGLAVPTLVNGKTMATFIVDTGATYTVITPRVARKLGVKIDSSTPRISIVTANGVVKAPVVTLKKVAIGQVEVENVKAVVQDLGGDILLSGLLGMNFFKDMDLTVRRDKLVLGLRE